MNVFELTRKLIDIPSPTGEEAAVVEFLGRYLEGTGFNVTRQPVRDGRFNILATVDEPRVVFSTHTDTVRPYFPLSEDDDYIYGRGACDTRGIIAAQIKGAELLVAEGVRDVGLLLVVGEEGESDGAKAAGTIPNNCRWLINGEPTENKIALGSKGALRVKLTTTGKACHSAYPEQGESAIEKMLDILTDIRNLQWPEQPPLGRTTCNIGVISGGIQPNVVPPHAEARLLVRVVTSTQDIEQRLTQCVKQRGELDFYFGYEPVLTQAVEGFETMVAAYGTDIPFLSHWGTPLLFGPGSILDAHTPGEKISRRQLQEAVTHYAAIARQLPR